MHESQHLIDEAFGVTPDQREELVHGEVPRQIRRRLQRTYPGSNAKMYLAVVGFLALAFLGPVLGYIWLFFVGIAGSLLTVFGRAFWRWWTYRHLAERNRLRQLSGVVETRREWTYGYGDMYYLMTRLEFVDGADAGESVFLGSRLDEYGVEGLARLWVVTVPLASDIVDEPFHEVPLALELGEDADVEQREPATPRPHPGEQVRSSVPAD